jgi:endonuclease/exonuclease/phosphatase (EEP) superfamily protein YafD
MKILKLIISFIAFFLAVITIIVSLSSLLCKYTNLPDDSIFQVFGYISFFWILVLSAVVLLLFLLLRRLNAALSYLAVIIVFVFSLHDFSLNFIHHRIPEHLEAYDSLKVIAYNVKYYAYGIEKISRFINATDAEVVLLSESVLTPEKLTYLNGSLNGYTIMTDNGHDLSILSKYPVVEYKIVELPTYLASLSGSNDIEKIKEGRVHRSFVHAVININGTILNVLSLRLIAGRPKDRSIAESVKWGKYLIHAQDEELSSFINYIQKLKGPVIFGGDLNVPPNSEIIHRINHYAKDTYLEGHSFGSFTFKVSFPTMRLDYLFHSRDIISKSSEVMVVNPVLSDHFPIRAEFLIRRTMTHAQK